MNTSQKKHSFKTYIIYFNNVKRARNLILALFFYFLTFIFWNLQKKDILLRKNNKITMAQRKLLLVVDAQNDFIEGGSLPVEGASKKMEALSRYILDKDDEYVIKAFTFDWHPMNHISFMQNGGEWPSHCIQHTHGASLSPFLETALWETKHNALFLTKGDSPLFEEYSIFKNDASMKKLCTAILANKIDKVDICGIAGDICVLNTLKDGIEIFGKDKFNVLEEFCPSIDGGKALHEFIENELKK